MIINALFFCLVLGAALTEAPDEADACVREPSENSEVECNFRKLSSDKFVVGSTHSDGAKRLAVRCSPLPLESTLRDHHFGRMQGLAEISIVNCKILRLPGNVFEGLRGLKALKIHSMNNEWNNNKELELSLGAFNGLKELHTLDLAYNNIRRIPYDLFCALENIISLNLTRNKIKFIDELGFSQKCGSTLQTIDLSHNDIMSLPADSEILRLRRLTQLFLQNNKITELPRDAFNDLLSLKVVNLSENAINYIPDGLFRNTREIREIYMQNNELETLPMRIFNRLEQLLVLDLSGNKLRSDHIEHETFGGLIRLIVLDLSYNAIARITRKMFIDLFFLQNLNLNNNNIGYIEDSAFSPMFNLHKLNLDQNKILTIEDHTFNGLYVLNKLSLNNNLMSHIGENVFKNCSGSELDLSSNKLTHIPEAITHLTFLKILDLGQNMVSEITNNSFHNLSQLTGLRLIENQIGNLTAGMFWGLPSLQVLNLAKNKIQSIDTETFQKNTQLEAVRLDGNFITDINGVFAALPKLLWLNLSENHLVWFDYAFIPSSLKWLDIHGNFIEALGNYYNIRNELHVETLDASHNRIGYISAMSIPDSVRLLFINNNFISTIETNTFLEKKNLTRVDMYTNVIETLDINSLRIARVPEGRALPEFYISSDSFRCDCTMKWLLLINSMTSRQYPRLMDLENVICKESYVRGVKSQPVTSLHLKDFLCKFESHCPDDCYCCDSTKCSCEIHCPMHCSCYHDSTKSTSVVDCSVKQLRQVPQKFPKDASHIYLDGNVYSELNDSFFNEMINAFVIYLNSSNILTIHNNTFRKLHDLRILHLDNNKLKQLRGLEFSKLNNLKELYLHNNLIEYISNETFSLLGALEVLRLDGNKLVNYGLWHLDNNKKLQTLFIGNNHWSCDCKYLQGFLTYVSQNIEKVIDVNNFWCVNENVVPARRQLNLNVTDCSAATNTSITSALFVSGTLPVVASIVIGFMIILLILAFIFIFRYACRMWLYTNCGIKLSPLVGAFKDADKLYDAYICYSPKDEEFVIETLARELENGYPSYHLCLHYRDVPQFEATYAQFPDLVIEATEASRRIIVVLTKNFIATEWSQIEFRQALQKALKNNPNKLIIVAVGQVPRDPEMKSYFKTGLEITWKEKRFWERLRYAMPSSKRQDHKLKRLNYGRNSNTYTMDASVLNSTCQTLCGKSANSTERSPCDRPLSEHIYSTIDSDYSSNDFQGRHNQPQSVVFQHTVQTYLV